MVDNQTRIATTSRIESVLTDSAVFKSVIIELDAAFASLAELMLRLSRTKLVEKTKISNL